MAALKEKFMNLPPITVSQLDTSMKIVTEDTGAATVKLVKERFVPIPPADIDHPLVCSVHRTPFRYTGNDYSLMVVHFWYVILFAKFLGDSTSILLTSVEIFPWRRSYST